MIPKRQHLKRTESQNAFFSIFLLGIALLIAGFLITSNHKISQKRAELNSEISRLKNEIQILDEKKQKLMSSASQGLEEQYLEKEARTNLGLKKPGEKVVVIKKEQEEKKTVEEKNFWQTIGERASAVFSPFQEKTNNLFKSLKFW